MGELGITGSDGLADGAGEFEEFVAVARRWIRPCTQELFRKHKLALLLLYPPRQLHLP